jgi:hypothetical protein
VTGGPGGDWDAIEEALEGLPSASPQVDARHAEVERLRAIVADYENRINWNTTCKQCATYLDSSIKDYERAERAEAERDAARAECSDLYPAIESLRDELNRANAEREAAS